MVTAPQGTPPRFLRRVRNRPAVRRRSSIAVLLQLLLVASGLAIGGVLAWGGYHWLHNNEIFRLRVLDLEEVPTTLRSAVRSRLEGTRNANLLLFDVNGARAALESIPQADRVRVRRLLPETLEVEIVPRPAWGILEGRDRTVAVARDGTLLGPDRGNEPLPRMRLTAPLEDNFDARGQLAADVPGREALHDAVKIHEWLQEHDPLAFGRIAHYRLEPGGVIAVRSDRPWEIAIGAATDMEAKAATLVALLEQDPPAGPSFIDLRFREMIVVRDLPTETTSTGEE